MVNKKAPKKTRKWCCGRGIYKLAKVVGTGLNQNPTSGGMGKVVKVVGTRGNRKAISGGMGRVFRNNIVVTTS